MISSEVQRTLVKSPPELWAEISDPESLARHLGEFGEIRITRVQPEQKVEWEAEQASGTVAIKPSGWGTKVKLTVTRELSLPDAQGETQVQGQTEAPDEPTAHADTLETQTEPEPEAERAEENDAEPDAEVQGLPDTGEDPDAAAAPAPEPRRGFFARLFGRRRRRPIEPAPMPAEEPDVLAEEPLPTELLDTELDVAEPEAAQQDDALPVALAPSVAVPTSELQAELQPPASDRQADIAAEIEAAEELASEQVTAVLTGVLDRLGAAHHRPFSRA